MSHARKQGRNRTAQAHTNRLPSNLGLNPETNRFEILRLRPRTPRTNNQSIIPLPSIRSDIQIDLQIRNQTPIDSISQSILQYSPQTITIAATLQILDIALPIRHGENVTLDFVVLVRKLDDEGCFVQGVPVGFIGRVGFDCGEEVVACPFDGEVLGFGVLDHAAADEIAFVVEDLARFQWVGGCGGREIPDVKTAWGIALLHTVLPYDGVGAFVQVIVPMFDGDASESASGNLMVLVEGAAVELRVAVCDVTRACGPLLEFHRLG